MSELDDSRIQINKEARSLAVTILPRPLGRSFARIMAWLMCWAFASSLMLYAGVYFWHFTSKHAEGIRGGGLAKAFILIAMLFWFGLWFKRGMRTLWKLAWSLTGRHELFVSVNTFVSTRYCCGLKHEKKFHLPDIKHLHVMRDEELTESMDVSELLLDNSYLSYQQRGVFRYMHFEMSVGALGEIFTEIQRLLPECCQKERY